MAGQVHLFARGQVDPELRHLQRAALLRERWRVELLVQHARGGGHPLHVTGADHAGVAGSVAVRHLALIDDGYGLEAAMRMFAHAARLTCRLELMGPGVIQHQERAGVARVTWDGNQVAHWKAVADPVGRGLGRDLSKLFHAVPPGVTHLNRGGVLPVQDHDGRNPRSAVAMGFICELPSGSDQQDPGRPGVARGCL